MLLAAAAKTTSHGLPPELILLYVVVIGAVYYFYLRPRNKRMKAQRLETNKVEVGERAQTIGGLVGTVVKNQDGLVTIRTEGGVELQFIYACDRGEVHPGLAVYPGVDRRQCVARRPHEARRPHVTRGPPDRR